MVITIGFVCLIGWIVGAWVPWWIVAAMWCGYGVKLYLSKQSGLENVTSDFLLGMLLIIATVSGFIFGDMTIVMLFTGGK